MAHGLLNNMKTLNDGLQLGLIPNSTSLQTLQNIQLGLNPNSPIMQNPQPTSPQPTVMPVAPNMPATAPQTPAPASTSGSGLMDFLGSSAGKGLLYGAGAGLLAKMQDRRNPIVPTAMAAAQQFIKNDQLKQLGQQMAQANLTPAQKAFVQTAFITQDPKMMETASRFLSNPKPVSVGAQSALVDPVTGKVIFQNTQGSSLNDFRNQRNRLIQWDSIPANQRLGLIAQASGLGIDPTEATDRFIKGETIADMARSKGLDPANLPTPIYPTTQASLTQIQKRQQALTEMDNLGKTIAEWTAPYARRVAGYSTPAMLDALKGENTDQVAKFLAARGASLDQAAIRVRTLGGNVGENVMQDMVNNAMGKINFPSALVGGELYTKTQKYLDQAIHDSVIRANKVGLQPARANEEAVQQDGGNAVNWKVVNGQLVQG